jgi:hypothetical protein
VFLSVNFEGLHESYQLSVHCTGEGLGKRSVGRAAIDVEASVTRKFSVLLSNVRFISVSGEASDSCEEKFSIIHLKLQVVRRESEGFLCVSCSGICEISFIKKEEK